MQSSMVFRIIGILLLLLSLMLLLPALIALIYDESSLRTFLLSSGVALGLGLLLTFSVRRPRDLRTRDGFIVTGLFYFTLGLVGALPLYLDPLIAISFTDAVFESVSGFTTTGATVLTGLDDMPRSILFYRQLLQWLGGLGIIVLAVAILPMLGIGGMQLYRTEFSGRDNKLTPRIQETAKALWYIYVTLTAACALAYYLAGMSWFDAICHSFSTVAIGGFSTYDASIGHFNSAAIEAVAIVFILLAGINFALHFTAWNRRSPLTYFRDWEVRTYFFVIGLVAFVVVAVLLIGGKGLASIRPALFQAVSIATTTGYTTENFSQWPSAVPYILIFAAFAGGCAGSTAGGIKMIRVLLIFQQGLREMRRLVHPAGVFHVKLGIDPVPDRVMEAVWGFFSAYVFVFIVLMIGFLLLSGLDGITSFSAIAATITNLGPGLGEVAGNYQAVTSSAKWLLVLSMILGRLEVFTLLVLLTPTFWRR
jgi:trk system potassium uptake protein